MSRKLPRLKPVSSHEVDASGELIVHDAAGRQLVVLNAVGAAMFELIDGSTGVEQMVDLLVDTLAVDREEARSGVEHFLQDLEARGIVELAEVE